MKAIRVDYWTEKCGKCGALVTYTRGLGTYTHGASECYEDWETVEHKFCPECGEKVDRDEGGAIEESALDWLSQEVEE